MSKKNSSRIDRKPRILVLEGLSGGGWAMQCVGADVTTLSPNADSTVDKLATLDYDGLLLTGGGDVSPVLYGEKPNKRGYGYDPMRDYVECTALREARKRGIPVLGICRGAQIMAVEGGGKLLQHLEGHVGYDHDVIPLAGTMFSRLLRNTPDRYVVSLHHQVVSKVGRQWQVAAVDVTDGTVEAIESKDGRCLGVQFHPEMDRGCEYAHRILHWLASTAAKRAGLVSVALPEVPKTGSLSGDYRYNDDDAVADQWERDAEAGKITAATSMFRPSTTTELVRAALARADKGESIGYWCASCSMVFDEKADRDDHETMVCGVWDHVPASTESR